MLPPIPTSHPKPDIPPTTQSITAATTFERNNSDGPSNHIPMSQPPKRKKPSGGFPNDKASASKPAAGKATHSNKSASASSATSAASAAQPTPLPDIPRGWDWYESIGNPRFVLSPMVGQSELAYRQLVRSHGAALTYTPMIIADEYIRDTAYRSSVFSWDEADRPLVVQLCATDPQEFVAAAKLIIQAAKPDAIELNLGCPQSCAERGGYGSWMMNKLDDIKAILTHAVQKLPVAITAKIRVFPSLSQTYAYVDMLAATGISLLTVHPRERHHKEEVLSQWDVIESIKKRVNIPVVLNGDIWGPTDLAMAMCLHAVDGYMCAQGALQMPAIFKTIAQFTEFNRPQRERSGSEAGSPSHSSGSGPEDQSVAHQSKKSKPVSGNKAQQLVQLSSHGAETATQEDLLPESITFISTKSGAYAQPLKSINHFRVRKDLGTALVKQPLTLPEPVQTILADSTINVTDKVNQIYAQIGPEEAKKYAAVINSYPLTRLQSAKFSSDPIFAKFVSVIIHIEAHIDQVKRQLQNAVEYIRNIEKYPIFHHSVAQRHLFFILFDLLNKHIDCYDMLYVAKSVSEYKDVIHALHRKAAANADFTGCKPDNYFTKNKKERNRRRDGTLAPPPWPVGGGGFNVALNGLKNKADGRNKASHVGDMAGLCKPEGKATMQIGGKKINMSKFD